MSLSSFRVEVSAGSVLFRQGDAPTSAFLLEQGEIEVTTRHGEESRRLGVLVAGDLLGEMAVIDDSPRTATATALTDCVLTPIDRTQFAERLDDADPVVRALLLSQLTRYRSALAQLSGQREPAPSAQVRDARAQDAAVALDKIRLESELREALERRELEVRLQPILEIATNRVAGFEALTRWTHPERGPVSPADFIKLAEETSLILPIGDYVLAEVCNALRRIGGDGDAAPFVALNVSGRQLDDPGLLDRFLAVLVAGGVAPRRLKIEITESLVLDYERVSGIIARCHGAGMKVALDDFGTGYSNLGHLHKLEFDTLKMDQGFIRQMGDPRCYAIVRAIVGMAHSLDCDIVAEGVETELQLRQLRELGCRYAQGWLIGKPLPVPEALALL